MSAGCHSLVSRITVRFRLSYLSHAVSAEVESTTADNCTLLTQYYMLASLHNILMTLKPKKNRFY